jgi:1,4-dihydroxy-2-naphthoyl-CoA hydrolase
MDQSRVQEMPERPLGPFMDRAGLEWVEIGPARVIARMPVAGNTQASGIMHGGATTSLCGSAAQAGAEAAIGPEMRAVGIEQSIHHFHSASAGWLEAVASPRHVGRTTTVWDVEVRDDQDRLISVSRVTLALRGARSPS